MKLLIASDIHGDANCCRALLDTFEKENAEKILILGDILYHGPRNDLPDGYAPKKVIEMLNSVADKLLCVRGNCDTEVDQMVLNFPVLSDTAFVYDSETKLTLYMSHGHKYSPESLPPISGNAVFLYGHTHLLGKTVVNGIPCINPGSVSLPKGGNKKSYATYESGMIEIKDFEGNVIENHKI
jgi:putative phosphoesterase